MYLAWRILLLVHLYNESMAVIETFEMIIYVSQFNSPECDMLLAAEVTPVIWTL